MNRAHDIEPYKGWGLWELLDQDTDRFYRTLYEARLYLSPGIWTTRTLRVSDFNFSMSQKYFNWFVDNDFPDPPTKGPWSSAEIDERIARAPAS